MWISCEFLQEMEVASAAFQHVRYTMNVLGVVVSLWWLCTMKTFGGLAFQVQVGGLGSASARDHMLNNSISLAFPSVIAVMLGSCFVCVLLRDRNKINEKE